LWSFSLRETAGVDEQGCRRNEDDGVGEEAWILKMDEQCGSASSSGPGCVSSCHLAVTRSRLGPALVEVGAVGFPHVSLRIARRKRVNVPSKRKGKRMSAPRLSLSQRSAGSGSATSRGESGEAEAEESAGAVAHEDLGGPSKRKIEEIRPHASFLAT